METAPDADDLGICRDCLTLHRKGTKRCTRCGSPRLLHHGELTRLRIAHVDCDAFYASVEKRDRPELRDKPVIIGGGKRGVVSTACYIARINGVKSAMPMFKALEICPEAIVIKPDMEKYSKVGREIRDRMKALTPLVQPISIDEAFLDLSGTEKLHRAPPAFVMAKFAKEIERDIGVSVSVGLSYCKFLAKVASDMDKPRGYFVIGEEEALDFLRTMPVSTIWGVGKSFEKTLRQDGITTVGQLQLIERAELVRRYGTMGDRLYHLSRGLDDRQVRFETEIKSVSSETTFNADLSTYEELLPILRALSEKVSSRLKKKGIAGHTIVLKLKTRDFTLRTRNRRLADSSRLADRIFRTGAELLKREIDGTSFRLIGIGVSDLTDESLADPPDLVDVTSLKWASAEAAIDAVREKFGTSALETGFTFGKGNRGTPQRDHDA